ncbi:Hypothetical predicted protein [Olea europaea subsp. europaea]|uniref:Uncharacterized protein n=1 Tax=Olea europaea subsp. europaea TaxID=158383 RepID=A0A8S0Q7N0_OLEEU|nr:Hypothetical predicted protein [Olea europaea subsp. europaea]
MGKFNMNDFVVPFAGMETSYAVAEGISTNLSEGSRDHFHRIVMAGPTPISLDFAERYPSDEAQHGYINNNDRALLKKNHVNDNMKMKLNYYLNESRWSSPNSFSSRESSGDRQVIRSLSKTGKVLRDYRTGTILKLTACEEEHSDGGKFDHIEVVQRRLLRCTLLGEDNLMTTKR